VSSLMFSRSNPHSDDLSLFGGGSLKLALQDFDSLFSLHQSLLDLFFLLGKLNFLVEDSDVSLLNSNLVIDRLAGSSFEVLTGAGSLFNLELDDGDLGEVLSGDVVSLGSDCDLLCILFDDSSPSLDSVGSACAWLLVDDHLSSLLADSESLLDLDDVNSLVLHLSFVSLDSDGLGTSLDLESPSLDLLLFAVASLLGALDSDGDRLAGSLASDDSVSVDSDLALDNDLSSLFSGLDEFVSDLLAVARLVFDDDLSGLLAGLDLVSEDDNLLLNLRLLFSSDGNSDLLGGLNLSCPSLDRGSAASTRLLDLLDSDGDLAGSLASSDSVVVDSDLSSGLDDSFLGLENSDSSLEGLASTSLDRSLLNNNLSGLGASLLVDSLGLDNDSVGLSDSSLFNSGNSVLVDSVLLLDSLASALLVLDNDILSGLSTDFDSSAPGSELLLVLSDSERLVSVSDLDFSVFQNNLLSLPSVNFSLGAFAWFFVQNNNTASSSASDNSVFKSEFLSLSLDESSPDLDSSESLSHLLATTRLSLNDNLLDFSAGNFSLIPNLQLFVDLNLLLLDFDPSNFVFMKFVLVKGNTPSSDSSISACARFASDDNLSGLLANGESVSVDGNSVVDSVGSDLEGNSVSSSSVNSKGVSPLSDLGGSAWARLALDEDDLSSSSASCKSGSDNSGVVVGLGDSDLSSPNSNLSLNFVAFARLVSDNNNLLAGLCANLGSLSPDCQSLLSVFSSLDSDLSELDFV